MKRAKKARGKATPGSGLEDSGEVVEQVQPEAAAEDDDEGFAEDEEQDEEGEPSLVPSPERRAPATPLLSVKLSAQLHSKLQRTAQDEGVSLESLVQELLAEGVTLRAWEIIERKSAMRGGNQSQGNQQGGNRNFQGGNHRHDNRRGGGGGGGGNNRNNNQNRRPGGPGNAWMEDKAAFLEYVRNQEKRRR